MKPEIIAIIVYSSALIPLFILSILTFFKKIPAWIWWTYISTFIIAAIGWEVCFTYGLMNGQNVNIRRPEVLNLFIPQHINWIVNSLADAGIVVNGILYVWLFSKNRKNIFNSWRWREFIILAIFYLAQNLVVELYIYQAQLAAGYELSWAPLSPFGNIYNPVLFTVFGKSVHLQPQMPWFLMLPIVYWLILRLKRQTTMGAV